jgi:hypothetical protein
MLGVLSFDRMVSDIPSNNVEATKEILTKEEEATWKAWGDV